MQTSLASATGVSPWVSTIVVLKRAIFLPTYSGGLRSHGLSKEASRCRIEAFCDVGIQNVFGFMADDRENGFDRIVTGPARSEAVAVGGKACFPFGFEHTVGQRLEGAVVYGGNPHSTLPLLLSPLWA